MVILWWGWVGWGGAKTFMSTCTHTHTSCYVMVIFSCACTHTSCYATVIFSALAHTHTHVMLRYGYLGVGLGGVRWGNKVHVNLHTHTSCYVMVIFSCTCAHTSCYDMVIFSCTCTHTSCYAMVIFSCTCTHTRHATLWLSCGGVGWGGVGQ